MNKTVPTIDGFVRYNDVDRAYDCRTEGKENFRSRIARMGRAIAPAECEATEQIGRKQEDENRKAATRHHLAKFVSKRPGVPLDTAIKNIHHHYHDHRTALQVIGKWVDRGEVPGVRIERSGNSTRLWPVEAA